MRSLRGHEKQKLRRAALQWRESLRQSLVCAWGGLIQDRALQHVSYRSSKAILLYSPVRNEVPTQRIRDHALAAGREVFYPRVSSTEGQLGRIRSAQELVPGRYGILEPRETCRLGADDWDALVVFVPAVLVDKQGHRIGRGGGWYDRTLASWGNNVTCIALVYDFQLMEEVPTENWDRPVNFIITEERVLQCRAEG